MRGLLDAPPIDLAAAAQRLRELRSRTRALLALAGTLALAGPGLWVGGSGTVGISVLIGSTAAVGLSALAHSDRRRLLFTLVAQNDAGALPEVAALVDRLSTDPMHRDRLAHGLRAAAQAACAGAVTPMMVDPARVADCAPRLLVLANALGDHRRTVTAPAAALCRRLLSDARCSPLYNSRLPAADLERVLKVIEDGIATPRHAGPPPL